jgi:hypothetical protein
MTTSRLGRTRLRNWTSRVLSALFILPLSIYLLNIGAIPAGADTTPCTPITTTTPASPATTVVADTSSALSTTYPYGPSATTVAGWLSPVPLTEINQLLANVPEAVNAPLGQRTVFPTSTFLYVTDVYVAADSSCSYVREYAVSLAGAAVQLVGNATGTVQSDGSITGTATEYDTTGAPYWQTSATYNSSPTNCDACGTSGFAMQILNGAICEFATAALPVFGLGFACGLATYAAGNGNAGICSAENCNNPSLPGMIPTGYGCQYAECTIDALVYNGTGGRSLISLSDTIIWDYPDGVYAYRSGCCYASEWEDYWSTSAPWNYYTGPFNNSSGYQWGHYASDVAWTNCTTSVKISVSAQWSDYSFISTGFQSTDKLATTSCPGYTVA